MNQLHSGIGSIPTKHASPKSREPDTSIKQLVIACIPDLPVALEHYARQLQERGTTIDILVWKPEGITESFDSWGRPKRDIWSACPIELSPDQVEVAADAGGEAKSSIEYALKEAPANHCSIILADPKLSKPFKTELWTRGLQAYNPDGERLIQSQAAVIAIEWESFRASRDLRTLRRLLELPAFTQSFQLENPLSYRKKRLPPVITLLAETVSTTLEQGQSAASRFTLPENAAGKIRYAVPEPPTLGCCSSPAKERRT